MQICVGFVGFSLIGATPCTSEMFFQLPIWYLCLGTKIEAVPGWNVFWYSPILTASGVVFFTLEGLFLSLVKLNIVANGWVDLVTFFWIITFAPRAKRFLENPMSCFGS